MKPLTRAIVWGGLVAGTGDLVFALSHYGMKLKVFQTVAAGLIGRDAAFSGGEATFALGVALHYGISLIWAALFCVAALRLPALLRNATAAGLAYGFVVYFGMNHVVLPLSALHTPFWPPKLDAAAIAAHCFLFGFPIALAARRVLLGGPKTA
ncbi:hypothetical protein J2X16_002335 [Pelomonas aquatica]|uniref:DUF1440 domain-containing protein n=1 Tax=Pelomonas aquatica TaxID=431058 RepID=A0ABU1Z8N8_9BURK|nr:hypothetical protein [Pelomonas aquatica]MDR7296988.1 hypothetical protein [Pelomonas aquatica]